MFWLSTKMSFVLRFILFGILVFCSETDGGSLTWEQPFPILTVQSSNPVDHFSSRQLHEGTINATLNWRFRLNQLNFGSLVISLNGTHIAGIGSSGSGPQAGFENEFGIDWNPNQKLVKLSIFKVTTEKNGAFTCQVNVDEVTGFVTKNFQFRSAVQVHVVVSPKVTLKKEFFVGREQTASLFCQVEGNPKPTISWSPCDPLLVSCNKQYLKIPKVQDARTNYKCTARNAVGIDAATTVLIIGGYNISLKMAIIEECDKKYSVWEALKKEFTNVFEKNTTESYSGAELINSSCSLSLIIFDVVLKFSTEVAEDDSISLIQNAIVDGKLGELSVWYIHGIPRSFRITAGTLALGNRTFINHKNIPTSTSKSFEQTSLALVISASIMSMCVVALLVVLLKIRYCRPSGERNTGEIRGIGHDIVQL